MNTNPQAPSGTTVRHRRRDSAALLLTALVGVLGLAGCASREEPSDAAGQVDGDFPVQVSIAGAEPVTIEDRPTQIVSLSPSATEMLFAIGAGDQVVAVDDNSDYPPEAPTSDLSGFSPSPEAVADHHPDLVVAANDAEGLVEGMTAVGVPVLLLPAAEDLAGTYAQIEALGEATGHAEAARDLATDLETRIDEIVADADVPEGLSFYHEVSEDLYSVGSTTFIGQVYGLFGMTNIADEAPAGGDYPQLANEFIVESNPDVIFLADVVCCGQSAETIAERPGWETMTAVQTGTVVPLDDDLASRWGPRVVEFVEAVADGATSTDQTG
nr:ABC transporter substrate-binding protein [Actinoalloteichus hoggarensis]